MELRQVEVGMSSAYCQLFIQPCMIREPAGVPK